MSERAAFSVTKLLIMLLCAGTLTAVLAGCGSDSGSSGPSGPPVSDMDDNDDATDGDTDTTDDDEPTTVEGTVKSPAASVASFVPPSWLQIAGGFFIDEAQAAMTGLQPVTGGTVELIEIDDNGEQVGEVIAEAVISHTGAYALELPAGVDLAANLVLRVTGDADAQLRAIATHEVVDIDPVADFIVQHLVEADVSLTDLAVNEVVRLRGEVDGIEVDAGTDLEAAFLALEAAAGPMVAAEIEDMVQPAGTLAAERSFFLQGLAIQLGRLNDEPEVWVMSDEGIDVTLTPGDPGRVGVAVSGTTFTATRLTGSGPSPGFGVETEVEGADQFDARFDAAGTISIDAPFAEELLDDLGIRVPPQTLRLRSNSDSYAYVGLAGESESLFSLETDGTLDDESQIGYRDGLGLSLMVERAAQAPVLADRYGMLLFEQGLDTAGCVESIAGRIELARDQGDTFTGEQDEVRIGVNCEPPPDDSGALEVDLLAGEDGGVQIMAGGEVALEGVADDEGRMILFPLLDRDEEGDSIDWVNAGMAVALAVADSAPDLTGSRWEFYELSADYDGTALSEVFGFSGSIVDIDQEGNVSFDPFRDVAVVRNAAGTPERAVTFEESAPAEALSLTTAAGGQVTFQQDSAIMSGFVSADGQIMTLLVTDATANDSGLILGFRRSG